MHSASEQRSARLGWGGRLAAGLLSRKKRGNSRVRCAACGALNAVPTCLSCGTRLPVDLVV